MNCQKPGMWRHMKYKLVLMKWQNKRWHHQQTIPFSLMGFCCYLFGILWLCELSFFLLLFVEFVWFVLFPRIANEMNNIIKLEESIDNCDLRLLFGGLYTLCYFWKLNLISIEKHSSLFFIISTSTFINKKWTWRMNFFNG